MPTINYIYHGNQYLCETDESDTPTKLFVNEPGTYTNLVSQKDLTTGERSYPLYDALGSTRAVTDDNGDVTDTFVYDAWGNVLDRTGVTEIPFQYVGKHGYYRDEETETNYVMARTYDPSIIRWLNVDPLLFIAGINLYDYCFNNPTLHSDPSGLLSGPWADVISWLQRVPGGDPTINWVSNPQPPNAFQPQDPNGFKFGEWLARKEFRNFQSMKVEIECDCEELVTAVSVIGSQTVGYTPLRLGKAGTSYVKGQIGEEEETISGVGTPCATVYRKVRFRVAWPENIGQAIINWKLFPWAWSSMTYKLCCNEDFKIKLGGSFVPSHFLYLEGKLVISYSMNQGGNKRAKQIQKDFKETGGGKDAPGSDDLD